MLLTDMTRSINDKKKLDQLFCCCCLFFKINKSSSSLPYLLNEQPNLLILLYFIIILPFTKHTRNAYPTKFCLLFYYYDYKLLPEWTLVYRLFSMNILTLRFKIHTFTDTVKFVLFMRLCTVLLFYYEKIKIKKKQ